MVSAMDSEAVPVTIIDLDPKPDGVHRWIQGDGTGADALNQAGVDNATGIVCGTSSDTDNLSIAVTARELNKNLFVIVRQNHESNRALFDAYDADITVVPSRVIALGNRLLLDKTKGNCRKVKPRIWTTLGEPPISCWNT